jgi:hypothetical protein
MSLPAVLNPVAIYESNTPPHDPEVSDVPVDDDNDDTSNNNEEDTGVATRGGTTKR